jgi:methionine-rich copper-binding protein CopC
MKRPIAYLAALVLPLVMAAATAHTGLRKATPEAGSTVTEAPKEIVLEFSAPVRLTAVSLASAAGKQAEMGAIPTETVQRFAVPVSGTLAAGDYVVTWRAVGAYTHVVSGEVKFKVGSAAAVSAAPAAPAAAPAAASTATAKPADQKAALPEPAKSGVNAPR